MPQSFERATLGGFAATRSAGQASSGYGRFEDMVQGVRLATPSGPWRLGVAPASAAGPNLRALAVGSEGVLGIITEVTVRLYGIPERILSAVCPFATLEGACNAVIQSIQLGLGVARMELLDPPQIRAVNTHSKLGLEEKPTLFLEFHGMSEDDVAAQAQETAGIAAT